MGGAGRERSIGEGGGKMVDDVLEGHKFNFCYIVPVTCHKYVC